MGWQWLLAFAACFICCGHGSSNGSKDACEQCARDVLEEFDGEKLIADCVVEDDWSDAGSDSADQADSKDTLSGDVSSGICSPGQIVCSGEILRTCTDDGKNWKDEFCPESQRCISNRCRPVSTNVYLVVDTTFAQSGLLWHSFEAGCEVYKRLLSAGSNCLDLFAEGLQEECEKGEPSPGFEVVSRSVFPLLAAYHVAWLLDRFADVPGLRVVLIHPPARTGIRIWDGACPRCQECQNGLYQAPFGDHWAMFSQSCSNHEMSTTQASRNCFAPYLPLMDWMWPDGNDEFCTHSWFDEPPDEVLERMFRFSVVGYPAPGIGGIDALRPWVDGIETVAPNGLSCTSDEDCGLGTCEMGECWEHANPEIRALSNPDWSVDPAQAKPGTPLLYLAAEFIRRDADPARAEASGNTDVCRRNHVVYIGSPVTSMALPMQVLAARWMRTGLGCSDDTDYQGGVACVGLDDLADQYVSFKALLDCPGTPIQPGVCAPLPLPPPGETTTQTITQFEAQLYGYLPKSGAFRSVSGRRLSATTHVILPVADPGVTYQNALQVASIAAGGGGRFVGAWDSTVEEGWFAPYSGDWENQMQGLVDAILDDVPQECLGL